MENIITTEMIQQWFPGYYRPVRGISLWQPWASLLGCGAKKYETRSWATNYRGPVVIHAAARPCFKLMNVDADADNAAILVFEKEFYESDLPTGCIVAVAELVGCHKMIDDGSGKKYHTYLQRPNYHQEYIQGNELLFGDWTPGRYAWEFKNMRMLEQPIPYKGMQGLWTLKGAA